MTGKRKIRHWLILAVLSLVWGSSYILMKKGLQSFTAPQIGSLRILITTICLLPLAMKSFGKLNRSNFFSILIIGYFGNGIPAFLYPLAQTHISSSLTGMLNTLTPVFTLITGVLIYRRNTFRSQVAGIFLGLIGAAGLLYTGEFTFNWFGLFVVLATFMNGLSANEVSKTKGLTGLEITALGFTLASPLAIIHLPFSGITSAMNAAHWVRSLSCIFILAAIGSAAAQGLFYMLIRETSPIFGTTVAYFIPVVATMWGFADNEQLTLSMLVSVLFIFAGVLIINKPELAKRWISTVRVAGKSRIWNE